MDETKKCVHVEGCTCDCNDKDCACCDKTCADNATDADGEVAEVEEAV